MMLGNGYGFNWQGLYVTSLMDFHSAWRTRADELSDTLKSTMLLGHYMVKTYRGHYYAKAQNIVRRLRATYDAVLKDYDLLLMPTLPLTATPLPDEDAPIAEILQRAFEMLPNTTPFDCTHHPAMSLPCGLAERPAGGPDADRPPLRREHHLPRRPRLRGRRRMGEADRLTPGPATACTDHPSAGAAAPGPAAPSPPP